MDPTLAQNTIPFKLEAVQRGLIIDQNIDLGVEIPVEVYAASASAVVSEASYEAPVLGQPTATVIREFSRQSL